MLSPWLAISFLATCVYSAPSSQHVLAPQGPGRSIARDVETFKARPPSHLSEWTRTSGSDFITALKADKAQDWIVVTGNEGGDLDSMVGVDTVLS